MHGRLEKPANKDALKRSIDARLMLVIGYWLAVCCAGPDLAGFLLSPFRKPKRVRTAFSPSQLLKLEHAFEKNHYVVGAERKQLAQTLNLTETQVRFHPYPSNFFDTLRFWVGHWHLNRAAYYAYIISVNCRVWLEPGISISLGSIAIKNGSEWIVLRYLIESMGCNWNCWVWFAWNCVNTEMEVEQSMLNCGILTFRWRYGSKTDGRSTSGCSRRATTHRHLPAAAHRAEAIKNHLPARTECIRSDRAPIRWTATRTTRTLIWKVPMTKTSSSITPWVNIRHWRSFRTSEGSAVDSAPIRTRSNYFNIVCDCCWLNNPVFPWRPRWSHVMWTLLVPCAKERKKERQEKERERERKREKWKKERRKGHVILWWCYRMTYHGWKTRGVTLRPHDTSMMFPWYFHDVITVS